jgi:predicted esterase
VSHFRILSVPFLFIATIFMLSGKQAHAGVVSKTKVYTNVTVVPNVLYRIATNNLGTQDSLKMDIYSPTGAPDTARPCAVLIHGGSFLTGTKADTIMMTFCNELALRGYIAVSINYRLGVQISLTDIAASQKQFNRAVYRAVQDSKAAIRFLKANATQYHIDTSLIFCGGYSAGAVTTVHSAYMNQTEAVTKIDTTGLGLLDEGENLTQSSSFKAAINYCGAIGDTNWLQTGDIPIISFHGTADTVVPYTMGNAFKLPLFPFIFGSGTINRIHKPLGVKDSLYTAEGEGHGLSLLTIAMSIIKVSEFLYGIVDPSNTSSVQKPQQLTKQDHLSVFSQRSAMMVGLDGRVVTSKVNKSVPGMYVQNKTAGTDKKSGVVLKLK